MACLYRHIRTDLNIPFYIGIGKNINRAYSLTHRNKHWASIVGKTHYEVEILFDEISYEFARQKEKEFIELYKRKEDGGPLCNITKGGEGVLGLIHNDESRRKMGEPNKGKTISEWHKKRISEFHTGKKSSEETKKKMSKSQLGKSVGRKASKETREKMSSSAKKGENNHSSKLTSEDVLKIRELNKKGMGQRKLGIQFNVQKNSIASIVNRITWKHI